MSQDFFDRILPLAGYRCVASQAGMKWRHSILPDNDGAAQKAKLLEAAGENNVYFACASYEDPSIGRKGSNAHSVRSFWLDLDTNEFKMMGDSGYIDKQDALKALARFCLELGIIDATVVDSGFGIHAYWSMIDDMEPALWSETARILRRVCDKWGLKVDHSRTTDIASILRVPGTQNWKDPNYPRPVKLMNLGGPMRYLAFRQKLDLYLSATELLSASQTVYEDIGSNTQLLGTYPPSDARLIADRCAVIGHIRDTAGNVSEPLWYAGLGVLVHTEQGDDICHEYSRGHPEYDFDKTQAKIDRLKCYGPTLCERLEVHAAGLCDGCPHKEHA